MSKIQVEIQIETDDRHDMVLDKIVARFPDAAHAHYYSKGDLIQVTVRDFEYLECHHMETSLSGNSSSRTFKEKPKAGFGREE